MSIIEKITKDPVFIRHILRLIIIKLNKQIAATSTFKYNTGGGILDIFNEFEILQDA